jgi:hypothetical protein
MTSFVRSAGAVLLLAAGATVVAAGEAPTLAAPHASRKLLGRFRAGVEEGTVRLRFYMTTPLFTAAEKEKQGIVLRIYRREEPGFTFGEDYAEYFDGAAPRADDQLFEGTLPAINGRKFEFVDKDVKVGATYAYWVSSNRKDAPVGPVAVKVRDPAVWWTAAKLQRRLAALAKAHPDRVALKEYGRTVKGRPIMGVVAGNGERTVALVGLIHAGESGPELIVPAVERLVAEDAALLERVRVAALPAVNADERERLATGVPWYLRTNASGVDLNRNFDAGWEQVDAMYGLLTSDPDSMTYRGPSAGSEPETQAVVALVREVKPDAVFSYHWLASISGCSMLAPKSARNDKAFDEAARRLLTAYARAFLADGGHKAAPNYACTPGSFPAWAYKNGRILAFDVEGSRSRPIEVAAATDNVTAEMIAEYQERHYRGIRAVLEQMAGSAAPR